jgi:hypothetical protein
LAIDPGATLAFGAWLGGGAACDTKGIIDEVRISNILRSQDWITAQYLSGSDNFITYGVEEAF